MNNTMMTQFESDGDRESVDSLVNISPDLAEIPEDLVEAILEDRSSSRLDDQMESQSNKIDKVMEMVNCMMKRFEEQSLTLKDQQKQLNKIREGNEQEMKRRDPILENKEVWFEQIEDNQRRESE